MPRAYHSPSSIELADKCRKAWGLRYIEGLRYDEQPWQPPAAFEADFKWPDWVDVQYLLAQTEVNKQGLTLAQQLIGRQRSSAFGKAMHSTGEGWYLGEAVDWLSEPGKVFLSGAHLLPHPERVQAVRIEQPIGTVPYTSRYLGDTLLLEVDGIHFMGFIDLEVLPYPEESARLGFPPGWAVIDYKSTKSLKYPVYDYRGSDAEKWAQKAEALKHDAQAALYAYAHAHSDRAATPEYAPPQRWVYFQTQGGHAARGVDVRPTYRDAQQRVHMMVEQAKRLDMLESIDQCMPNPSACPEYGGCEFHVTKGGPCNAERRLGAAVNQVIKFQTRKETHIMPEQTPAQTRFQQLAAARRGGQAAQQAPAPQAPAPAPVQVQQPAPQAPAVNSFGAPTVVQTPRAPRAPRRAAAPEVQAPPPPPPPAPVEEVVAGPVTATGPVYKLTIECSDPAELAAITEIISQALIGG